MNRFFDDALLREMENRPWKFSFLELCRRIDARLAPGPGVGEEPHPVNEVLRLGQEPSTVFAAREISGMRVAGGRLYMSLFGLGLYGPNGPLPLHLTEDAHERRLQKRDSTLIDFLDLFHHRWLTLFYRCWAAGQSAAGLDRREAERFSVYVANLEGYAPESLAASAIPPHARLGAVSHLLMQSRNPAGLTVTLEHFFGVPLRLEEYRFHWLTLEEEDHSRLGGPAAPARLGRDGVLGRHVPDRQSMFTLHFGPLTLREYCRFLPSGRYLPQLIAWVRAFAGLELEWTISLSLHAREVPPCRLSSRAQPGERLGRTSWLARRPSTTPMPGKEFSPERRALRAHRNDDKERHNAHF